MSYVAAEPGVLISPTDDLQSPRSAPAAHDENADGITGGTRDDSAPNSRFQLGRRIPEATAQEGFLVRPFTQQCQIIHTEGDHAVIGVSPGNSYFSRQRLRDLGLWGLTNFDRVDFVYTDVHVAESYEALGDSAIEARRKAVKNIRGVRAKITTTVNELDPAGARLCVVRCRSSSPTRHTGSCMRTCSRA